MRREKARQIEEAETIGEVPPVPFALFGILQVAIAAFALVTTGLPGLSLAGVIGISLFTVGLARLMFFWQMRRWQVGSPGVLAGLFSVWAGLICVLRPGMRTGSLAFLLAAYWLASGLVGIVYSMEWRPLRGWQWIFACGLTVVGFSGFLFMNGVAAGANTLGLMIGIELLLGAVALLKVGMYAMRVINGLTELPLHPHPVEALVPLPIHRKYPS